MKKSLIIDQSWVREWTSGAPSEQQLEHLFTWLRTAPNNLRPLILNFPPMCVVKPTRALEVPYPGTVAIVASYNTDGRVGIRQEPSSDIVFVLPSDITVVGCWKGMTTTRVAQLFEGQLAASP